MSAKFLQASFKFIPNWQRSAEEQDLHDDLRWIVRNVSNPRLVEIFERRARSLCRGFGIFRIKDVASLVRSWRDRIEKLGATDLEQRTSALQHHEKVAKILTDACIILNGMKISPNLSSFQKKIEEATWKDRRDLEGRFSNHTTQMNPSPQRIEISFMNSDQPAVTIEGQFSKYAQIRLQLLKDGHIDPGGGHIWVRRSRTRRLLPPSGYYWEHASANSDIEAEAGTLHVQFVDVTYRNEYIVAILHNGTEREFPEALDLVPSINGTDCCPYKCTSLSIHLHKVWPQRLVTRTCRLNGDDASSLHLNDTCFRHLTNDLYLRYQDL